MLHRLANNTASFFVANGQVHKEEKEIYAYGMEFLLATFVNIIILITIALLTRLVWESVAFMVGFAVIRRYLGGYHAPNHLQCFVTFLLVYIANMVFVYFSKYIDCRSISILLSIVSIILVFWQKPVLHKNKSIDEDGYYRLKVRSRFAVLILGMAITAEVIVLKGFSNIWFSLSLGILTAAVSALIAKIIECEVKNEDCKENYPEMQ